MNETYLKSGNTLTRLELGGLTEEQTAAINNAIATAGAASTAAANAIATADAAAEKAEAAAEKAGQVDAALPDIQGYPDFASAFAAKADKTDVDAALALKLDKADMPELGEYPDFSAAFAAKADKAEVDAALDLKANKSDLAGLGGGAGMTDEERAALAAKADKSYVDAQLDLKANKSDLAGMGGTVSGFYAVLTSPDISLAEQATNTGAATPYEVTARPLLQGQRIDSFIVNIPALNVVDKVLPAVNNKAADSFTVPAATAAGTVITISAIAVDSLGNRSAASSRSATVSALRIAAPRIISPVNGETNIVTQPAFIISDFILGPGYSDAESRKQLQVARDAAFTQMAWDSGELAPTANFQMPFSAVLEPGITYYARARWKGTSNAYSPWSAVITFTTRGWQSALGVCQPTTGVAGQNFVRIDTDGQRWAGTPAFNSHAVYAGISEQVIDGQQMVGFPKFFVKRETLATGVYKGKDARFISDVALPGFDIHPAFLAMDGRTALERIWIGKYQANSTDNNTKAGSLPGGVLVFIDFPTMQARCRARNENGVDGFHLWNIHEHAMIALLMLVEYAGTDFQKLIGRGLVDAKAVAANNNATVAQASWRGLVGLWGNVWQMCDGLLQPAGKTTLHVDMGAGSVDTGLATPDTAYFPDAMMKGRGNAWNIDHLFLGEKPATTLTETTAAYPDQQYLYSGKGITADNVGRICYVGGNYNHAGSAGLFLLDCRYGPAYSYSYIGGRLAKW